MAKRKAIGKKTRFEVFKRDGFACQYCGAKPPQVLLQVDHIIAVAAGGGNDQENLVTACQPCNIGKGARGLDAIPQTLAEKAMEVAEREAQLIAYSKAMESKRIRLEDETWRSLEQLFGRRLETYRQDSFNSTKRFVEALGLFEVLDAADIARAARSRDIFRYFCGVCWKKIREANL